MPFYSFEDAERLKTTLEVRSWAQGTQPACVVGGGVVGIELAFALAEMLAQKSRPAEAGRVIVLEALDEILRGMSPALRTVQEASTCTTNLRQLIETDHPRERFTFDAMGDFLRTGSGRALADVKGVVMDGRPGGAARRAAYLARLPAWATRLAAVRQWLA